MNTPIGIFRRRRCWRPVLVAAAVLLLNGAPVEAAGPALETDGQSLHSQNSRITTAITFVNKSGQPVRIYWLDFSGQRILYGKLGNEDGLTQATYLTHPWLITDESGNAWNVYHPAAYPRTVHIVAPWRFADARR
jgi:hypothetical protein